MRAGKTGIYLSCVTGIYPERLLLIPFPNKSLQGPGIGIIPEEQTPAFSGQSIIPPECCTRVR